MSTLTERSGLDAHLAEESELIDNKLRELEGHGLVEGDLGRLMRLALRVLVIATAATGAGIIAGVVIGVSIAESALAAVGTMVVYDALKSEPPGPALATI